MLNNVTLLGRLTKTPELNHTKQTGIAVTGITLAVNRRFNKKKEQQEADFIQVVAWGPTAEFVCRNFTQGKLMSVVGRLQNHNWEDNEGNKHYTFRVMADNVGFAGFNKDELMGDNFADDFNPDDYAHEYEDAA